mgnify:CR=1 FL=1|jgi:hypothetical protein
MVANVKTRWVVLLAGVVALLLVGGAVRAAAGDLDRYF